MGQTLSSEVALLGLAGRHPNWGLTLVGTLMLAAGLLLAWHATKRFANHPRSAGLELLFALFTIPLGLLTIIAGSDALGSGIY